MDFTVAFAPAKIKQFKCFQYKIKLNSIWCLHMSVLSTFFPFFSFFRGGVLLFSYCLFSLKNTHTRRQHYFLAANAIHCLSGSQAKHTRIPLELMWCLKVVEHSGWITMNVWIQLWSHASRPCLILDSSLKPWRQNTSCSLKADQMICKSKRQNRAYKYQKVNLVSFENPPLLMCEMVVTVTRCQNSELLLVKVALVRNRRHW